MDKEIHNIAIQCLNKWKRFAQEDMTLEEMSELAKSILKLRRIHTKEEFEDRCLELIGELVDVQFMLEQMKYIYLEVLGLDKEYDRLFDSKIDYIKGKLNEV